MSCPDHREESVESSAFSKHERLSSNSYIEWSEAPRHRRLRRIGTIRHLPSSLLLPAAIEEKLAAIPPEKYGSRTTAKVTVHATVHPNRHFRNKAFLGRAAYQGAASLEHRHGHRIKIGVIDTGVDFSHPDLRHSLSRGINLLTAARCRMTIMAMARISPAPLRPPISCKA